MLEKYFPIYTFVFFATLLLTALIEHYLIPYLKGRAIQPIYEDGPVWHAAKGATPTMGGLAFLISSMVVLLGCSVYFYLTEDMRSALSVLSFVFFCVGNSLIGLIDDLTKLKHNNNAGLTPIQKLTLQAIITVIFLAFYTRIALVRPSLSLGFIRLDSFFLYFPTAIFITLGIVNCANLTDGIDGLASSVAYSIGICFFVFSAKENPISAILAAVMIGASLAFLFFNINPAKIFMGDTGSLLFGALAVSCAFSSNAPLSIIPIGIIYVIEGVCVVLQVAFFKLTKRRLFKMAPLHHHLEKCGMSENKICLIAMIVTFIFALIPMVLQ